MLHPTHYHDPVLSFSTCIPFFQTILGYLFIPFSFLMGVDWDDALKVGRLIGLKVTANEFLAYIELGVLKGEGEISVSHQTCCSVI